MRRDLSKTIGRLSQQQVTVTRRSKGTTIHGRYTPNPSTTQFPLRGSVQPISDRMIELLPEGDRQRAKFAIYSAKELQIDADPDTLTYKGLKYEVQAVRDWQDAGNFFVYAMLKIEAVNP